MSQPSMAVPSLNPAFEEIPFPSLSRPRSGFKTLSRLYTDLVNNDEVFGFTLLILGQMFNTVMLTTCKLLVTDDNPIHPIQILFVRMAITYICCLLYMLITRSVPYAPFGEPSVRKWLLLRGVVGFFGVFGSYFSLLYLSMSDSVAITFLVPLITGFLAWILLRERYSLVEAMCGLVSLCGVMLIAKPHFLFGSEADKEAGSADDSVESSSTEKRLLATGVALLGALAAASVFIILRKIGNSAHPLISVSFFSMVTVVISSISIIVIPSISFAIPQDSYQWSLFFTIGIAGFLYQFALTAGVQRVKASKASLVVYLQMVFAIALDVIIWHHFPGFLSILGILVIVGCTLVVMKYKSKPAAGDLERGTHQPLSQDDDGYKPEDIQLQDFVIDDEDDENENVNFSPSPESATPDVELNSVKDSGAIKLNI